MKKLISLLLLLVLIQSCATDRIRYVRVKGEKKELVAVHSDDPQESRFRDIREESNTIQPEELVVESSESDNVKTQEEIINHNADHRSESPEPSILLEDEPKSEKIQAALWAEDQAFRSRRNMRLSVIFLGASLIPLVGFLFFIPALILFIIAWTQFSSANRSRYITAKGDALLSGTRYGFYVWGIYALLAIIGVAIIIGVFYL